MNLIASASLPKHPACPPTAMRPRLARLRPACGRTALALLLVAAAAAQVCLPGAWGCSQAAAGRAVALLLLRLQLLGLSNFHLTPPPPRLLSPLQGSNPVFTGVPTRIADGDTLTLPGGVRIRFHGIDAPESDQTCKDGQGAIWACGQVATDALRGKIGSSEVSCEQVRASLGAALQAPHTGPPHAQARASPLLLPLPPPFDGFRRLSWCSACLLPLPPLRCSTVLSLSCASAAAEGCRQVRPHRGRLLAGAA